MSKTLRAGHNVLAGALAPFPQVHVDRTALVPAPHAARGSPMCLIAEFNGRRVDDVRQIAVQVNSALGQAGLVWRLEFVRAGWLPTNGRGAVDQRKAALKYQRMHKARGGPELLDGSFAVLAERDKDRFRYFGNHSKIRTPVEIAYPGHVAVGNWVSLGRYGKIVMLPQEAYVDTGERYVAQHYPELVHTYDFSHAAEGREGNLYVGDGTTLGDRYFIICTKSVEFGKHVMTAANLFVSDCHHTYENTDIPPALLPVTTGRSVRIEDHVWIGMNCCILEGVTVGRHAVVAANSVVNDDVPPYTLVAGAPARVKKRLRA